MFSFSHHKNLKKSLSSFLNSIFKNAHLISEVTPIHFSLNLKKIDGMPSIRFGPLNKRLLSEGDPPTLHYASKTDLILEVRLFGLNTGDGADNVL